MNEKERLERRALAFFLRHYNRKNDTRYRIHIKQERPDFIVKDKFSGELLGVEISHIFHDKKEAMMILGRDASHIHGIITSDDHVRVLERILKKKAEKFLGYDFDGPIILVIRDYTPIFDAKNIFDPLVHFKMPASGFREVWYLNRTKPSKKWDRLVRLK